MEGPLPLKTLSEKTLHQTADPRLTAYCPSMDLVALGTTDQQVLIYRLNGQRVYGATQKNSKLRVNSIKWKPNGQLLAVAWNDGSVRLVGAESGKIVHQFSTGDAVTEITCMGWSSNLTNKTSNSQREDTIWNDLLNSDSGASDNSLFLNLPRDLSLIDIERSLPKLSLLAAGGSTEDVFSSRSSLDALFRPFDPKDNDAVDIMVVGTDDGEVHLTIYDSFLVGSFQTPKNTIGKGLQLIKHSSSEQLSTHALLMKCPSTRCLYFVPMDLRFISASTGYLSLLASRSTALQNLLRYIHQVQNLMISEWKSTQELPGRFLRNINETLTENNKGDIVQSLYHSVATGHTLPAVKEWLVDELSERGHKRWEKAVVTGLENIRRLIHENMLPALERCSVILSRFSGIAKFQGDDDSVGFSSHQISLIVDTVACLHLVSSKILLQVIDELDLFAAFSSWLRYEIDRLGSDSTSARDDDLEKEAAIDHNKVLLYLQNCMTTSSLEVYFGNLASDDVDNDWTQAEQGLPMFDLLDKQISKQEQGLPYMKGLPRVELLCKFLSRQAQSVFSQIAEAEKRNVLFGQRQEIGTAENDDLTDMRLTILSKSSCVAHLAFVPKDLPSQIQVNRLSFSIENSISKGRSIDASVIQLGDGQIKDLKFLDSSDLLVLWQLREKIILLSIPYSLSGDNGSTIFGGFHMEYTAFDLKSAALQPMMFSNKEVEQQFMKYKIPGEGSFLPERINIRYQTNYSQKDSTRIVILGEDKMHFKVFRFPESASSRQENGSNNEDDISMSN
ncbi:anaphase-promoting complex, cyclosome, subunit 4-domain-containing protein [Tricladium varicosporioides]|nr:anaphase-promoting complex, cyclosome, subunit 4-domain-containing protein [Hymenoscyphus varicosporioides]